MKRHNLTCSDICPVPPTPVIYGGTSFIIPSLGGPPSLLVYALVINDTPQGIAVQTGPACPLGVTFAPYPSGGELDASSACASGGASVAVAPNDTAVLTRIFGPDSLALFAPGMYTVSVAAETSFRLIGVSIETYNCPSDVAVETQGKASCGFFVLTSLLVVIATVATFVWPTRHRYDTYHQGDLTAPVRIGRFTSRSEVLMLGNGWTAISN